MFKYLLIVFILVSVDAFPQTTPNIGFDNGTFDNWQCWAGTILSSGNISIIPTPPLPGRHTLVSKGNIDIDPFGKFPVVCPNGSKYSIVLGNQSTGSQAERVSYTLTVPSSGNYSIVFDYAVVLQNPNHLPYQQPAFTAKVFDVTDNKYIDCPSFDFISGGDLPGFIQSGIVGALTIYYKDWSKATIDLHGYPNKIMRIEFTTNDCAEGGHFGYAYLDVEDSETSPPITGNSYCIGQKAVTLIGPSGFADYQWYTGDLTTLLWQGQSLTISPPPPDLTWYALKVSPYPGGGCPDILYTVVNQINSGFQLKVQDTLIGCPGIAIDLTSPSVSVGSSPGTTYKYFTDSLTSTYLVKPNTINNAGTYYIQGISKEGCTNILPVQVIFRTPTIKVTEPAAVYFPTTINLSKTFTPQTGLTYSYYRNANGTDQLTDYTAVKRSGKYYIQATNTLTGCSIVGPVDVTIIPPPPYEITTPNTFTPNGDGINDHFNFTHSGSITFGSLRIYNRNGQLLFTAKSFGQYWDGNFNGKNVPAGTYYWVFEGEDDYNNVKINKGGSITLIR